MCQDTADPLGKCVVINTIIIDFTKTLDLVPHDGLLMKLAALSVDLRIVVWVRELLVGRTQRVTVGEQLLKEVKVTSVVTQGSVLGPLLLVLSVNDIWRNIDWSIRILTGVLEY